MSVCLGRTLWTRRQILALLQSTMGLIWLQDNQSPVIGVLPKWLLVQQHQHNQQHTLYERTINGEYLSRDSWSNTDGTLHDSTRNSSHDSSQHYETVLKQKWHDAQQQWHDKNHDHSNGFQGGLIGFLSYDFGVNQLLTTRKPSEEFRADSAPTACFGEYDVYFKWVEGAWCLFTSANDATINSAINSALDALFPANFWCERNHSQDNNPPVQRNALDVNTIKPTTLSWQKKLTPLWDFSAYETAFNRIQAYLQAGDCYQVNLTQCYAGVHTGQLLTRLEALMALTRAPFAGYFSIPTPTQLENKPQNYEILSCSPELFIAFQADGKVITRPIKGTKPRDPDPIQDAKNAEALKHSEKDRSENVMIVDLLRNDLSIHAQTGSVKTTQLFAVESFAQVHHLVSEIVAMRAEHQSALDVLFSAFPGGSITGAPKKRAMEIIQELEVGARGAYCGSLGYLNYDDSGQFNILIRTVQSYRGNMTVWAGGGITIASTVNDEYQECEDKIRAIVDCLNVDHST